MGKQLVLGSVLGAIVLFVWSAIAWMLIPWPGEPLRTFTNEDAVAQAIKANAPRSGNYLLPNEPKRTPGMTNEQSQKDGTGSGGSNVSWPRDLCCGTS